MKIPVIILAVILAVLAVFAVTRKAADHTITRVEAVEQNRENCLNFENELLNRIRIT